MIIAVLGGGNGSLAAAADMSLAGHEVRLWRRDPGVVAEHHAAGNRIEVLDGAGEHVAEVAMITADMAEAVAGAALILCPAPAHAQESIAGVLAPCLTPGQVVFLPPGTLGTMIFAAAARAAGTAEGVAFAETGTLPWLVRKQGLARLAISTRAVRLPTGVFPLWEAERAIAVIDAAFPGVIEPCGDALSGALMNAGPIIHSPLVVMNAGPLQHFDRWDIHNEGTQPAVRRVTDRLDAERVAVREAFGYGGPHFPLADHYRDDGEMWMYDRAARANLVTSGDWREDIVLTEHRYVMEDMRLGLSLLCSAAGVVGVATPVARGLMEVAGAWCGEDFSVARPLSRLGFGGMDRAAIQALLRDGWP